jgi:alpha-beta hydrolase superfamily lysophospholipase
MEENASEIIDSYHPEESKKFKGIENLKLTWKYLSPSDPNPKRVRVFYRHLSNPSIPLKASICFIHGFAEHSGKHLNTAAYFALNAFDVHLIDLRSFGSSGGARCGHDLLEFQEDVYLMLQQVNPELPCFLFGHSMGGLILATILVNNPLLNVSGAVISAPLFGSDTLDANEGKEWLLSGMANAMKEGVFNSYVVPSSLSRDDFFIRNLIDDPKIIPFLGPAMGLSIVKHMNRIIRKAHLIKHPVVFFHGDADILTSPKVTEMVFRLSTSKDKQLVIIPGAYHETHHDLERDLVIKDMFEWVNCRVRDHQFGKLDKFNIGLPGMDKEGWSRLKIILAVLLVVYFVGVWRVKVRINFPKLLKILNVLAKLFWPVSYFLQ